MSHRRIKKELSVIAEYPDPAISVTPSDDDILLLYADFLGPEDTPYEGGVFRFKMQLPNDYPFKLPKITFLTKILHPNVTP